MVVTGSVNNYGESAELNPLFETSDNSVVRYFAAGNLNDRLSAGSTSCIHAELMDIDYC